MINTTNLVPWLEWVNRKWKAGEISKAILSDDAIDSLEDLFYLKGKFRQFLIVRRYKSGLVHLAKVR